jgi:hypothetical protein
VRACYRLIACSGSRVQKLGPQLEARAEQNVKEGMAWRPPAPLALLPGTGDRGKDSKEVSAGDMCVPQRALLAVSRGAGEGGGGM